MALMSGGRRASRRVFMCTECHKAFRSREELYLHAEMCLLEAFETEASQMLADMPNLDGGDDGEGRDGSGTQNSSQSTASSTGGGPPAGMTIRATNPDGTVINITSSAATDDNNVTTAEGSGGSGGGKSGLRGFRSEKPPMLMAEMPTPAELRRSRLVQQQQQNQLDSMEDVPELRRPLSYAKGNSSETRTIETPKGLKLMVSVERPDEPQHLQASELVGDGDGGQEDGDSSLLLGGNQSGNHHLVVGGSGEDDELDDEQLAALADEDVSLPPHQMLVGTSGGAGGSPGGGVSPGQPRSRPNAGGKQPRSRHSVPAAGTSGGGTTIIGALANGTEEDLYKPKMECPTCGLVLYRHNFSTHYRIHTGEMPFHCSYCDKRFRTTSALKVHVRAHTGEKPYICPRCNYACITKRNLDRHIINNHVREGTRRGPRYRRSRYRMSDPHHEEYLIDMARSHAAASTPHYQEAEQIDAELEEQMLQEHHHHQQQQQQDEKMEHEQHRIIQHHQQQQHEEISVEIEVNEDGQVIVDEEVEVTTGDHHGGLHHHHHHIPHHHHHIQQHQQELHESVSDEQQQQIMVVDASNNNNTDHSSLSGESPIRRSGRQRIPTAKMVHQ